MNILRTPIVSRSLKNVDWDAYSSKTKIEIHEITSTTDVNDEINRTTTIINSVLDDLAPKKLLKNKDRLPDNIIQAINSRNAARRALHRHEQDPRKLAEHSKCKDELNLLIQQHRENVNYTEKLSKPSPKTLANTKSN